MRAYRDNKLYFDKYIVSSFWTIYKSELSGFQESACAMTGL